MSLSRTVAPVSEIVPCDVVERINAAHAAFESGFRTTMSYALEAGDLLIQVKDSVAHGAWLPWLKENFKGDQKTAWRYMQVAAHRDELEANQARVPNLSLRSAVKLLTKERNSGGEAPPPIIIQGVLPDSAESSEDLPALVSGGQKFATIYADPPWQYGNQATRASTDNHYPTMTPDEIAALPIRELAADDAHLHLWTTNAFLFDCQRIVEAWGFTYKSCLVWVKPQMGIGNYWRVSHEFLMLGVRGDCPFLDRGQMSWIQADRTTHSTKPERIRKIIEKVSPSPRLELFGRRLADGWTVWGNQITRTMFDTEAA